MGTAAFGPLPMALPSNTQFHTQCMWGAIGWSVGAALGAALAAREISPKKRTVLFVEDGSLQLVSRNALCHSHDGLTPDGARNRHDGPPRTDTIHLRDQQRRL